MRSLFFIVIFGIVRVTCFAQPLGILQPDKDIFIKKGDYFFERYEFKKAIIYYQKSLKIDSLYSYALLKTAEAYSLLEYSENAELYYRKAVEGDQTIDNEYILKFALVLLANKKYEESKYWLSVYNQTVEEDLRGRNFIESIDNINEYYKDSVIHLINNARELNSPESEINPIVLSNQIIFSSARTTLVDAVRNGYYDIFTAAYTSSGDFEKISSFNISVNTSFHEGPSAISGDGSLFFFTRNIADDDDKSEVKLGIFRTTVPQKSNEQLVITPVIIDNFNYSIAHPAVNYDGTIMYFISDAQGGIGGVDLYRSTFSDGKWSYPENLGNKINTKGDEMFPFLQNDTVLYFASDGHGGLGGLDIFKVNLTRQPYEIINMRYPVNSNSDDFGLFLTPDERIGYLSSNRPGGMGSDDIYRIDFLNFRIKGTLVDASSKEILGEAKISMLDNNGKEFLVSKSEEGEFEFSIIPGESYTLIIEKENYEVKEVFFDNDGTLELRDNMLFELEPVERTEIKLEAGHKYNFISGTDSTMIDTNNPALNQFLTSGSSDKSVLEINLLDKQMKFEQDEIYSMHLIKDKNITGLSPGMGQSLLIFKSDTMPLSGDSVIFTLPVFDESLFKIQSDIDYITGNYSSSEHRMIIDNKPLFEKETESSRSVPDSAVAKPDVLLSLKINNGDSGWESPDMNDITVDKFSVIPGMAYTLKVGKKSLSGEQIKEIRIPLTSGVKYNFNSDPVAVTDYREKLNNLLKSRQDANIKQGESINISLLSKELEIKENEHIMFNLIPDSTYLVSADTGIKATKVILDEKSIELNREEELTINVPCKADQKINIQTDIDYIQENFSDEEYSLDIDTIPFFSEIIVDTTGYYLRYREEEEAERLRTDQEEALEELERLLNMSINTTSASEEDPEIRDITAEGFQIIPGRNYTLLINRKNIFGLDERSIEIPLSGGVKYIFGANPDEILSNKNELGKLLEMREGVDVSGDNPVNVSILSKDFEIKKGEEYSVSLLPDSTDQTIFDETNKITTVILAGETIELDETEKLNIKIPCKNEQKVNIQTDISYLQENFNPEDYITDVDTIPFFSEIIVDTTGYYMRYQEEDDEWLLADQEEALKELERLLQMSIITTPEIQESTEIKGITTEGFQIIPGKNYTLQVSRKNIFGIDEMTVDIPLTGGIKYNFGANPDEISDNEYQLDELLKMKEGVIVNEDKAIDISLLSKDFDIHKGEVFTISLLPDSSNQTGYEDEAETTSIILKDETIKLSENEKLNIQIPYTSDQKVNIQTDIKYLQENYSPENYTLDVDTIPFFSEIIVDTTGYYLRYREEEDKWLLSDQEEALQELERLLQMSISTEDSEEGIDQTQGIRAEGFQIIPGTDYILQVSKKNKSGTSEKAIDIPLTHGVKYNFGSGNEESSINNTRLDELLEQREGITVDNEKAIDITVLSKELKIDEGEEFTMCLLPDTTYQISANSKGELTTTVILADESIQLDQQKLTITIPYRQQKKVNIETDITYLQENYSPEEYTLVIDTIPFFSEIIVDTTGYHERFITDDTGKEEKGPVIADEKTKSELNIEYRVQIAAARKAISSEALKKIYSGKRTIKEFDEEGWHKYYIAIAPTYFEAKQILNSSGVKDAFIAAYQDGKKLTLKNAMTMQYEERMERDGYTVTGSIINIVTVNFEFNQYSLRNDDRQYLQNLVIEELKLHPEYYTTINGHTDIRGDNAYNYALSEQRAEFVKGILLSEGIDENKIRTFSFGETQVLKACDEPEECDESVHQVNRRVEIILYSPKK